MKRQLSIIGAPSSAGAYAPGQEKAPRAMRQAGLMDLLREGGLNVLDHGDVTGFRWRADSDSPNAMNVDAATRVANDIAKLMEQVTANDNVGLVLGGDCSIEIGTVAGVATVSESIGLVYFDLDTDLNTPKTTTDGALDWMGVAHMLDIPGTIDVLTAFCPRKPLLSPDALYFFAHKNVKPWEQEIIDKFKICGTDAGAVSINPKEMATQVVQEWAKQFDHLLIHFDVDAIDFEDFPIAEHTRRKVGLTFEQAMTSLGELLQAENLRALTIAEINPDHGRSDGSTIEAFTRRLSNALVNAPALRGLANDPVI